MSTLTELFTNIANSIRSKTGGTAQIKAEDFPAEIGDISVGIIPEGTTSITQNGTYDVTAFASASVAVPASGITPTGTKNITANGTHDVTNYASANVNVPVGITPSGTKNITENGTFDVTDFASAAVNIPIKTKIYTATVGTTATSGAPTVLAGDDFLKSVLNSSTGFVAVWLNDPPTATIGTFLRFQTNFVIGTGNTANYKGVTLRATSTTSISAVYATNGLAGTNYNGAINMKSDGSIYVNAASNYPLLAGTYTVIAGTV